MPANFRQNCLRQCNKQPTSQLVGEQDYENGEVFHLHGDTDVEVVKK